MGRNKVSRPAPVAFGQLQIGASPDLPHPGPQNFGDRRPGKERDDQDDVPCALPEKRADHHHHRKLRQRQEKLNQKGEKRIRGAAAQARQHPRQTAEQKGKGRRRKPHRHARKEARRKLGIEIHAEVIGAEPVRRGRLFERTTRRKIGRMGIEKSAVHEEKRKQQKGEQKRFGLRRKALHPPAPPAESPLIRSARKRQRSTSSDEIRKTP